MLCGMSPRTSTESRAGVGGSGCCSSSPPSVPPGCQGVKRREWRWPSTDWGQRKMPEEEGVSRGVSGVGWVSMVRAARELRGLTVRSWKGNSSAHALPGLPSQAKLPPGQGLLEISESWESVLGKSLGKGPPRLSEGSAKLPWGRGGSKRGSLGSLKFPGPEPSALPLPEPPAQPFWCLLILVIF